MQSIQIDKQMILPGIDLRGPKTFDELNLLLKYCRGHSSSVSIDVDDASSVSIDFVGWLEKEIFNKWAIPLEEVERRAAAHDWEMMVELGLRYVTSQDMPLFRHFRALV